MSDTPTLRDRIANWFGYIKASPAISNLGAFNIPAAPLRNTAAFLSTYAGWVYACVKARSLDVSRMKLRLYRVKNRKTGDVEEVTDHDVLSLLRRVSTWMTFQQLIEYTQAYKDLAGEAFWFLQTPEKQSKGIPKITGIWLLRPDWVDVNVASDGSLKGYTYRVPGLSPVELKPEQVIPHREFNPLNPYRGMSIVQAAAQTVDTDVLAEKYNLNFFKKSALPQIVLSTEQKLDEDTLSRMRAAWDSTYGGTDKAHGTAILEGGLKLQPYAMSQKDMEFLAGLQFNRDKILAMFQVPKTVLGMTENVQVSNAYATDMIFAKRVIRPSMQKIADALNEYLLPQYEDDLYFEFDDPTPEDETVQIEKLKAAFATGAFSPNEIREALGHEALPGLDDHFIPLGVTTVDIAAAEAEGDEGGEVPPEKSTRKSRNIPPKSIKQRVREAIAKDVTDDVTKTILAGVSKQFKDAKVEELTPIELTDEQKGAIWNTFVEKAALGESKYKDLIHDTFRRQEAEMLARLDEAKAVTKLGPGDVDRILFDLQKENKVAAELIVPFVKDLAERIGENVMDALGLTDQVFDIQSESMREFFRTRAVKGIKSMNKVTRAQLRETLKGAVAEGLGVPETGRRIRNTFDDMAKYRAERIARTEVLKASNRATLEAYKQSDVVVGKQWLTALDEQECEWCQRFDPKGGKPVVIGLDDDFLDKGTQFVGRDGGVLDIDFDAIDTPPLHPNCRCTLIPITVSRVSRG